MISNLLKRLPRGALLLAGISFVNVVLGFSREVTIAYFFGTSAELDAFLVALTLPKLIVVNAVQISVGVVLPLYVGYREAGKSDEATALVQRWFWYSGKVLAVVCVALFVLAEPLMHLLAPGFTPELKAQAVTWLRILLPYLWLMAIAGTFKVVLDTYRAFFVPPAAVAIVSLSVIVSCAVWASEIGVGAIAVGFVGGGMLGFTLQALRTRSLETVPAFRPARLKMSLPVWAGGALVVQSLAQQLGLAIDRGYASTLQEGSVAALSYAQSINAVPTAVVSTALATAMFPTLSEMAAKNEWDKAFRTSLKWLLILGMIVVVPMIGLIVFREEVVTLFFKRGNFDSRAVSMTASVLAVLPLMFLIQGGFIFFERLLLAQRRMMAIVFVAIFTILTKFALSYFFVRQWGLFGLALSTVVTVLLAMFVCIFFSYRFTLRNRKRLSSENGGSPS